MTRARLFEVTRYTKPPVSGCDGIIQRAGSQGGKDYNYNAYHPAVMSMYDVRIAYHYLGSATSWLTQVIAFLAIVKNDFQVLACDLEDGGNVRSKAFIASAVEFLLYLQKKGFHVVLYTNEDMYNYAVAQDARIAQFELWFAWPANSIVRPQIDTYQPPAPKPWTMWQYAFGEHEPDTFEKDVFNGDVAALRSWAGVDAPAPQPEPSPVLVPAIPGPFMLLSHREAGEGWFWPDAPLSAYPAAIPTRGGIGTAVLSSAWKIALRAIMTLAQWNRTWVNEEGWHNSGDAGTVKEVEFAHNKKWVTKINADGWYEYETYYNSDYPPALNDPYRRGVMTVDYKTGHEDTGGVIPSDLLLPYISIARDRSENLRIDPKYMKPLAYLPLSVKVSTGGGNLNVRNAPATGTVLSVLPNGSQVSVLELTRVGSNIWGRTEKGFIAMWLTDWRP